MTHVRGEERVATGLFGDVMMMTGTEGYGDCDKLVGKYGSFSKTTSEGRTGLCHPILAARYLFWSNAKASITKRTDIIEQAVYRVSQGLVSVQRKCFKIPRGSC